MTILRIHQQHTLDTFSRQVQDAAQIVGERVLACEMWNSQNVTSGIERCKWCYDDIYGQSDTTTGFCSHCYGTTYENGIALAHFTSAVFGAINSTTIYDKIKGEYTVMTCKAQFSPDVQLNEKDYVLRIPSWLYTDEGLTPKDIEVWQVSSSFSYSYLKDGFHYLGDSHMIGYQCELTKLTQHYPLDDVLITGIDARVVSDNQPFIFYDKQYPIWDWATRFMKTIKPSKMTIDDKKFIWSKISD